MAFKATLDSRNDQAVITLEGDLDASTASIFQEVVEQAAEKNPQTLVLEMTQLDYISSAGLRQLVYARQKMSDELRVVLVGVNERVTQTIRLVGFDQSVTFSDAIPE